MVSASGLKSDQMSRENMTRRTIKLRETNLGSDRHDGSWMRGPGVGEGQAGRQTGQAEGVRLERKGTTGSGLRLLMGTKHHEVKPLVKR